jgi:hypothetical protein
MCWCALYKARRSPWFWGRSVLIVLPWLCTLSALGQHPVLQQNIKPVSTVKPPASNVFTPETAIAVPAEFKAKYRMGLGLSSPDYLFFSFDMAWLPSVDVQFIYSPPVQLVVNLIAPPDQEVLKTRLKAGTPSTEYPTRIKYKFNAAVNAVWRPWSDSFYASMGFGYRHIYVASGGPADLFVCLVTPDINCNKDNETFPSNSEIHLQTEIESKSFLVRAAVGYKWQWSRLVLDWQAIGFILPVTHERDYLITTRLVTEQSMAETQEIMEDMEEFLALKEASIRARIVSATEKADSFPLPVMGLSLVWMIE